MNNILGSAAALADPTQAPNPLPSLPSVGSNGNLDIGRIEVLGVTVFALMCLVGAISLGWRAKQGHAIMSATHTVIVYFIASILLVFGLSAALIVSFGSSILRLGGLGG